MTRLDNPLKQNSQSILACGIALSIVAGIFAYLLIYHVHHQHKDAGHLGDFPTFYQAAQFARAHRDIYLAGQNPDQMYVYPPLIAVLYMPLTDVSLHAAATIMLFLTAAMLLASMTLGSAAMLKRLDRCDPPRFCIVLAAISVLCENEMRQQMTMLETDALMLLSFVLALWWLDRHPILAGFVLAFAFHIKYLSIVALPWFILRRRWAAAGAMVAGIVGFALLPALQLGWKENLRCLRVSMGGLLRWVGVPPETSGSIKVHNIADGLSVSITSGLARILGENGFSNPQIMVAATAVGIVALLTVAWMYFRSRLPLLIWPAVGKQMKQPYAGLVALEWAGLMAIAVAFSPNTNARHLLLTMPVFMAGVILILAARRDVVFPSPGTPGEGRAGVPSSERNSAKPPPQPSPAVPGEGVNALQLKTNSISVTPAIVAIALIFWSFIMPLHHVWKLGYRHYRYSGPGWSVLIGYLLILMVGVRYLSRKAAELTGASGPRTDYG